MSKTILYPFRIDRDFRIGYAWSVELARRLKARLSLFTTIAPLQANSSELVADVYHALADAQGFYIRNFQVLRLGLRPVKSERNFPEGEFVPTLSSFIERGLPDVIVLQSDLFSNELMKNVIDSQRGVIVLSPPEDLPSAMAKKDRSQLFLDMLHHAALYNIPASFFKNISRDTGLFNYLASFFRK